jgi:signal transduction histidine kinase
MLPARETEHAMKKPFWTPRTKLLFTLGLVVLPAAALIFFSAAHLKSIQRDHAVEAAFQRDFQQMLMISDKHMSQRIYEMVDSARVSFPCPVTGNVSEQLNKILADHPWASQAFVFDKMSGTVLRTQPGRADDPDFESEGAKLKEDVEKWFEIEGETMLGKLRKAQSKGESPYLAFSNMAMRGGRHLYQTVIYFPIDAAPPDRIALGGIAFDPEYLQNSFFPEALNGIMAENGADAQHDSAHPQTGVMLHFYKDYEPIAASSGWDGGRPEVEHKMEGAFPDLTLAIKYRGTTIDAITQRFLRTSYIILGVISLLLIAGLFFTFRSVNKAMELAKLKSDIVSNVSHELRTPLSLIRLYAETLELERVPDAEKKLDYYRIIRKESERLTALINNILDFSRIEAGRKEYEFRDTHLPSLVRSTMDAYRYQIEQNGFSYEEHITDDLPPVRVDREAIARSLLNLVNNAIKYSASEKYIAVSLYRNRDSVNLEVVDHGIGIPRTEQSKIFDKFYRVCDPLCHENKGSGLGLSLVRHIVHAHGGEIAVESTPGRGSKFTIVLPLQPEAKPMSGATGARAEVHEVGA